MERGRGDTRGAGMREGVKGTHNHMATKWLSRRDVLFPNQAKAKSCYCCYPSISAKSGTRLPGTYQHTNSVIKQLTTP